MTVTWAADKYGSTGCYGRSMHPRVYLSLFLLLVLFPAATRAEKGGVDTYSTKGCAQIGDTLVCGATEIAAAVLAALLAARAAAEAANTKPTYCFCVCGSGSRQKPLRRMPEFECRATCVLEHGFPYGDYSCK